MSFIKLISISGRGEIIVNIYKSGNGMKRLGTTAWFKVLLQKISTLLYKTHCYIRLIVI